MKADWIFFLTTICLFELLSSCLSVMLSTDLHDIVDFFYFYVNTDM